MNLKPSDRTPSFDKCQFWMCILSNSISSQSHTHISYTYLRLDDKRPLIVVPDETRWEHKYEQRISCKFIKQLYRHFSQKHKCSESHLENKSRSRLNRRVSFERWVDGSRGFRCSRSATQRSFDHRLHISVA